MQPQLEFTIPILRTWKLKVRYHAWTRHRGVACKAQINETLEVQAITEEEARSAARRQLGDRLVALWRQHNGSVSAMLDSMDSNNKVPITKTLTILEVE